MLNKNLRKIRKEKHLTQSALAERIHYSQQAVAKWESGKSNPDMRNLLRLSNELQVSIDALVRCTPENLEGKMQARNIKRDIYHMIDRSDLEISDDECLRDLCVDAKVSLANDLFDYLERIKENYGSKKD